MKLGALGGPNTFGGDAARQIRELYPEFSEAVFFPTVDEAFTFSDGAADAVVAPQQMARTGCHPGIQGLVAPPRSRLHVIAEATHAYHCSLLVKPGTRLEQITRVLGHTGSLSQSQDWLKKNLAKAEIVNLHTSTLGAAQAVTDGDGSTASVGTPGMGAQFGLEELAKDIDGGSVGSYWVISPDPMFSDTPRRLVVAGRFRDDGALGELIVALGQQGFTLQTIYGQASGQTLFEYDYVVRLAGEGSLASVQTVLDRFAGTRLVGAFEPRG
ncbi:MAG TPA: prephenate dehydratase domain-containing protein [Alphaproteobacteria bacterium]|nr:prephenate dehydratase domain-containing protein [Alphaproteobacteria bacterium]